MKISDEEVQAALSKYYSFKGRAPNDNMRAALEAAYTVRKARKAAKRSKAKPEQEAAARAPEQPEHRFKVGDRVVHEVFGGVIIEVDNQLASYCVKFDDGGVGWVLGRSITPESAKPEWNGKFEVGKAYRTRDGRKATVGGSAGGRLLGHIGGRSHTWSDEGLWQYGGNRDERSQLDLISPWED